MSLNFEEIESSALNLDNNNKARLNYTSLQSIHSNIDTYIEMAWIDEDVQQISHNLV